MADLTEMHTRLSILETKVDDLDHDLFGNGQPGALDKLEAKIDSSDLKMMEQLEKIHEKINKVFLIVVALAAAAGFSAEKIFTIFGGG